VSGRVNRISVEVGEAAELPFASVVLWRHDDVQ
jgi:hypothetical protein